MGDDPRARPVVAAIDIGTNSVLLQVATLGPTGELVVLADRATITRLGRGVDAQKRLHADAIERTVEVLRSFAACAREHAAAIAAVGTSALRDAGNAGELLSRAAEVLGAPVEVICGEREAHLSFLGATCGLPRCAEPLCVIDIGGGSTEIVVGAEGTVRGAVSLDIGAVRLTERHSLRAPLTRAQRDALEADVARALSSSALAPRAPLFGIGGTITTLAAIAGGVEPFDPPRIHGARLSRAEVCAQYARLASLTPGELRVVRGLDPSRADIIVAGTSVLVALMVRAQAHEITVSNGGVRTGLAASRLGQFRIDPTRGSE